MSQISVTNTRVILRQEYIFLCLGNILLSLFYSVFKTNIAAPQVKI